MTEWSSLTLEEICAEGGGFVRTGPFGAQLHKSDYVDDPNGIPVVMPKDMAGGSISLSSIARIDQATADRLSEHLLAAGDVALSRRGDVGRSAFIEAADLPVLCGTGSMRIHLGEPKSVKPQFLRYFFRSRLASDYLEGHAVGATMPNLNASIVNAMPVPVPPVPVQDSIGEILSSLDDLIENNRRRVEVLEEMARAIYREWFVHFRFPGHEDATFVESDLGPIPEGWSYVRLVDAANITMGQSPKSEFYNDDGVGLPFHQGVTHFGTHYPSHVKYCSVENRVAEDDDVLVSVRAPVGRLNTADCRLVIGRGVAAVRSKDDRQALLLGSLQIVFSEEDSMGGGTIFKAITKKELEDVLVPKVPDDLAATANARLAEMRSAIRSLTYSAQRLEEMRDMLLPKLVTGQIDVSDLDLDAVVEKAGV